MKSKTKVFYRVDWWDGEGVEEERGKWVFKILLTKNDKVSFGVGGTKIIFI